MKNMFFSKKYIILRCKIIFSFWCVYVVKCKWASLLLSCCSNLS